MSSPANPTGSAHLRPGGDPAQRWAYSFSDGAFVRRMEASAAAIPAKITREPATVPRSSAGPDLSGGGRAETGLDQAHGANTAPCGKRQHVLGQPRLRAAPA